jgi:hypothetical protein
MIHAGQIGAIIRLTSDFDLSSADTIFIRYRKPDGSTGQWTATLNGTTNIQYTTTDADDLDVPGEWTFQGYATFVNGSDNFTNQVTGTVSKIIAL